MAQLNGATDVGFIGLGAMGKPMVENFAKKLPDGIKLHVYDIVSSAVDALQKAYPGRVYPAASPADVASKSVSCQPREFMEDRC